MENLYRVHDSMLLSLEYNTRTIKPIYKLERDGHIQYLNVDTQIESDSELTSTVWYSKFINIDKKINKYWNSATNIIKIPDLEYVDSYKQFQAELLLQQGFKWDNIFGILFVLKDRQTNIVHKSKILLASDFLVNYKNEMINGTFWASSIKFWLPDILLLEQSVSFGIEIIKWEDIHNDNTILNYPIEFESLTPDMPLSDKINVDLNWNEDFQLEIEPKSLLPEYTLEQILKWNFSISEINNLSIQHSIKFKSDDEGNFYEYMISNDVNPMNKIIVGLPLIISDEIQIIEVTTYFKINGLLASRFNRIVWNHFDVANNFITKYIATVNENTILSPVDVIENITIENKIIETVKDLKISQIFVPTFIQLITDKNIIADNKNIGFNEINFDCFMKVYFDEDETSDKNIHVLSQKTVENKYFFDISEINNRMEESNQKSIGFKIIKFDDNKLVLSGNITKK
mgnify:CR=1 FL=1